MLSEILLNVPIFISFMTILTVFFASSYIIFGVFARGYFPFSTLFNRVDTGHLRIVTGTCRKEKA